MQLSIFVKGAVFVVSMVGIASASLLALSLLRIQHEAPSVLLPALGDERVMEKTPSAEMIEHLVFGDRQIGLPVRLVIPKINVAATVLSLGLTPTGAMDAPATPDDVAWFDQGPRPGEIGSAVISGHFGWKNGQAAVFDDLHKLAAGDNIFLEDERGVRTAFVVRELRKLKEHDDAGAVFGVDDDRAHLNLITCGGVWNKTKKSYSDRLVVFADKVDE